MLLVCVLPLIARAESKELSVSTVRTGADVYRAECAKCHGPHGEGGTDDYDEPLYGDRSVDALARFIAKKMPKDRPGICTGDEAQRVAHYIYDAFYSPVARARLAPENVRLSHLTVRQYAIAVADLVGSFRPVPPSESEEQGLTGQYFASSEFARNKKVLERRDSRIELRFDAAGPDAKRLGPEYTIRWTGSLLADETGEYELSVATESAVRLWLNDDAQPLIDAWVSAGGEVREHKNTMFLLGGRAYPLRIEYFKSNQKNASLVLRWKAPHRVVEVVPAENLRSNRVPPTLIVTTAFPPDDSSAGYERGIAVSREWSQAAAAAAAEIADKVVGQIDSLSGATLGSADASAQLQRFCEDFAARAFRRPLSDELRQRFVTKHFAAAKDVATAVKRSLLLVLQSPRFLYPDLSSESPDDYAVASRLALALWDSLPDEQLTRAAANRQLHTSAQVTAQARRMLRDVRTREKLREFFHQWLKVEKAEDVAKDPATYPGFDAAVLADLRQSLDLFLDDVVWNDQSDYRQLLLADYLFLNDRLGKFYGVSMPSGSGFRKVTLQGERRAGVITHPYLLAAFAYHNNSSPIHRGVFLTRNILGRALKPPPKAVAFKETELDPSLSMREKITKLTQGTACQSCHTVINPLGFSLEDYDGVGRHRTVENRKPVNTASEYQTSDDETIRFSDARDVAQYAAASSEAQRGFIQQLFHAIVKQPVGAYGSDTLEELRRTLVGSDYNLQALLSEIARRSALHGSDGPDELMTSSPSPRASAPSVIADRTPRVGVSASD